MKIAATTVSMDAARTYTEVDYNNTIWQQINSTPFSSFQTSQSPSGNTFQENFFTLIQSSTTSQQAGSWCRTSPEKVEKNQEETDSVNQDQTRHNALSSMVKSISGTSINIKHVETENRNQQTTAPQLSIGRANLTSSAIHVEQESIFIQTEGTVQTESGQTISFNMGVQMQRQEVLVQSTGLSRIIHGIDPIVLNFDANISMFDNTYFSFDLDGDGSCEEISGLADGCGFLALDRNGDGLITDGLELFGPTTGSGFTELAELDMDGNSWIDENDPIFDKLLVWLGAGGEGEQLVSLRQAGVGAISVTHAGTQFTLEGMDGQVQGVVRASGMFLMENGEPKSLLEIDIVPRDTKEHNVTLNDHALDSSSQRSINNLREIIFWQRLKLQIMLTKQELNQAPREMMRRLQHISSGPDFSLLSSS
ncbi:hypothetical protein [Desulforhopalus sp. IMCC35007]|uniref:hypothetical protein n=1 Tax=Desulforhopalus sp. IMCC35007 TaxID=2569543 RepID=UPI0010AE00A4|nr:hypothetical protein [Desulforhopalus sp. IMCC35007]TKB11610.1 hypothetical protein FCL48_02075 [Desulforhopalus sp. IMCC35007]